MKSEKAAHAILRQGRKQWLVSLTIMSVAFLPGCLHTLHLDETSGKKIYKLPEDFTVQRAELTGLVSSDLLVATQFTVTVSDLPLEPGLPRSHTMAEMLPEQCIATLQLKPSWSKDSLTVYATLWSPFSYKDASSGAQRKGLSTWLKDCHCERPQDELKETCFAQRLANTIDKSLASPTPERTEPRRLTPEARKAIERAAGMPFATYDQLRQLEYGLAKPSSGSTYLVQRLDPGQELCFHTSAYAPAWYNGFTAMLNTSEPAHPACFPWQTIAHVEDARDQSGQNITSPTIGIDPFGRVGNSWIIEEGSPSATQPDGLTYLNTPDAISGPSDSPYRFALVFVKNTRSLLPATPSRDLDIQGISASPATCQTARQATCQQTQSDGQPEHPFGRGSFIVMVRDLRLADYIRDSIRDSKKQCDNTWFGDENALHKYFSCLTREWAEANHIVNAPETIQVAKWMREVLLPANVRPFVRLSTLVDGAPTKVRAGTTLLDLIDQRLSLSAQVFEVRSQEENGRTVVEPSRLETRLIKAAAAQVRYWRRSGVSLQAVDLDGATRLEDLLIPLNAGDRLTWRR
ncbi:hypothetical protein [Azospirillum sp. TSO35-2]|uniref:hypothetical protein n=1 Tax=Azospirillum sp. TSO35-2 TaxID=716796 RepID=UPI0011B5B2CE|nr:hypothetical protein [Azospirillum sp. TSO35-2]